MNTENNQLSIVSSQGSWQDISSIINTNFYALLTQVMAIKRYLGFFVSEEALTNAYPKPMSGAIAFVLADNNTANVYAYEQSSWIVATTVSLTVPDLSDIPPASETQNGVMTIADYKKLHETTIEFDE